MILLHHEAQTMLQLYFPVVYSPSSKPTGHAVETEGGRQITWIGLNSVQEVVSRDSAWDFPPSFGKICPYSCRGLDSYP